MTETLVWDEAGARYYETGVSRGILFPIDGSTGVPWNGLVNVQLDPQGGDAEHYFFDGVKYMDQVLAENFQATIQCISTPKEFRPCEGVREFKPGVMTEMNKRDKFHFVWRTEISNDQGQSVAYKLHVAYNNLAQPAGRNYQTLADTTTMDIRNITITATPACGRHSYFWFDSRDYDLTDLEAQLATGVLPKCYELAALVTPVGEAPPVDPDEGCASIFEDFEGYVHGQTVSETTHPGGSLFSETISGQINNGLDIIDLPAVGAFAANDSAASEVGTGDILADDDDATYITSADGDLGYTVGLPPLVGYVEGCTFELHIRASISGGVNPDDPDNIDADMQVHISTDDTGDTTIGGFSDGADEGMGFAIPVVDGSPVDLVIPLQMDAWVDSTLADVVTALEAGAYLNVVGATNNNPDPADTPIEVDVYELTVRMLNDTDPDKWLRPPDTASDCSIEQHVYSTGTTDSPSSVSDYIDFKVMAKPFVDGAPTYASVLNLAKGIAAVQLTSGVPNLGFFDDSSFFISSYDLTPDKWYRVRADWSFTSMHMRLYAVDDLNTVLLDATYDTDSPVAFAEHFGGWVSDTEVTFEVALDNAKIQVHCSEVAPENPWIDLDLSTAIFFSSSEDSNMEGQYVAPVIKSKLDSTSFSRHAQFHFSGFTLDPTKTYEFKAVYAAHTYGMGIYQQNPSWESTFWSDNKTLASTFADTDADNSVTVTVGPGISQWNDAITAGYQTLIRFDMATNGDTGTVDGANLVSLSYREV